MAYNAMRNLRASATPGKLVKQNSDEKERQSQPQTDDPTVLFDAHSALNISLFPPLFFFSGLYYTDVVSTLLVLVSYTALLKKQKGSWGLQDEVMSFFIGILALCFRQTNIFWVAVFPAILAVVDALKKDGTIASDVKATDILKKSWSEGRIYDAPVNNAAIADYVLLSASIAFAAINKLSSVLKVLVPYIALLAIFAGFVLWNGSVVLGKR